MFISLPPIDKDEIRRVKKTTEKKSMSQDAVSPQKRAVENVPWDTRAGDRGGGLIRPTDKPTRRNVGGPDSRRPSTVTSQSRPRLNLPPAALTQVPCYKVHRNCTERHK